MLMSNMICLTETWLRSDIDKESFNLPGYDLHLNSFGEGKGILTYSKNCLISEKVDIKKKNVQITKMCTDKVDVISIYRSQGADQTDLILDLKNLLNTGKTTIICGDFNLCFVKQRTNKIIRMLEDLGFQQLVSEASHLKGGHLDHVYSNHDPNKFENEILMYSPYYTSMDHDAICLTLRQVVGKNEDRYIYEFSFSGVKLVLYFPGTTYKKR